MASPRVLARSRTMSARLVSYWAADMPLPYDLFMNACWQRASTSAFVDPPIDRHHGRRLTILDILADGGHVPEFAERNLGDDLRVQRLGRFGEFRAILRRHRPGIVVAQLFHVG